ncbi:MAG: TIGR01212 family radical SAM protein [Deltaproteobacteria bacterium]|nr:TIGR01212 family radical SAM protein [Deltaproteobacteria bacterium]
MKRYRDFNSYLKERFGERVQKISLDAGLGCPNRDGTISRCGCIFCDGRGSGTGALINRGISIEDQIVKARKYLQNRYKARKFIAYFQSFSNTYAPLSRLKSLYSQALAQKDMVGLSVGTRPDCVDMDILKLMGSYQRHYLVWIEYGLQSAHDETLQQINRGHDAACFERSVYMANECGLNICAHIILGLPGENREMMLQTARFLSGLPIQGVKIHFLYVVAGTRLAELYKRGEIRCLEQREYVDLVVDFLEILPSDMVVQRLTGDPVKSELIAPSWAREKTRNLNLIRETLEKRNTWQGRLYERG